LGWGDLRRRRIITILQVMPKDEVILSRTRIRNIR
jgi:hypothetical protein